MRHRQAGRKLGRTMAHREMMMRNLVTSLVLYEKIITTAAKAKDLRGVAEKMVTLAKREDLHARRQAAEVLTDDKALKKLFETIGARFRERDGGYTRITKLDYRMGDGAPLAAIEFLGAEPAEPPKTKAKAKASTADKGEDDTATRARRRRRRRGKRGGAVAETASPSGSEA
jgi:large subunit ribosomal protein L17